MPTLGTPIIQNNVQATSREPINIFIIINVMTKSKVWERGAEKQPSEAHVIVFDIC